MSKKIFILVLLFAFCSKNEELSGGAVTSFDFSLGAFGRIAANLKDYEKIQKFNRGSAVFKAIWQSDINQPFYGLGPLLNSNSCSGCHTLNGRGRTLFPNEKEFFSMSFKISQSEEYGKVLQLKSIHSNLPAEVKIEVSFQETYERFPDGEVYSLRKPVYYFKEWGYGVPKKLEVSARVAPVVYGLGLLSLIPEQDLKAKEDVYDNNKDGISGKLNIIQSETAKEIGRFGWKASHPSIKKFIANALVEDMGITNEVFLKQNCTKKQTFCNQIQKAGMEIDFNSFSDLEFYIHYLAVPARRNMNDKQVQEGKKIFHEIGCALCHIPEWKTGEDPNYPELSNQFIYPYTDLMLHDMGEELADELEEHLANGREWRTPPLWGIGLYSLVSQHSFLLHDGRARNFQEAILWHSGEAKTSKERYMNLSKEHRYKLLKFLESL